jgi:uncharacterized protein YhaN
MRIAQLDLKAYGHFTDRRLVFAGAPDFHLAYGPNEAGKTTISRALNAALFGVPHLTPDNHLHANADLRVGVVLTSSSGERLAAMRRKARKNSLVAYDPETGEERSEAIADERLAAILGGLNEMLFTSMFGLDHDELVAGGKMLAEGKGELGQSLFEAGAGLASIRTLRERLAREADELFRPRASSSAIYKVLDQYGEARKDAKEAQTRPADWEALKRAADEAAAAYATARERQETLQRETRRLERLAAVLPDVAGRAHTMERLALLGDVIRLAPEDTASRIAAESRLRQAQQAQQEAQDNIARLSAELEKLTLPEAILAEAGGIEALYYSLKAFRMARDAVVGANGKIGQAEQRIRTLLAAMGEAPQDDLRALIPGATLRARVQSLVTRGATLQGELAGTQRLAESARKEVADLGGELDHLGRQTVPASLLSLLDSIETLGDPEANAAKLAQDAAILHEALVRDAAALSTLSVDALATMGTPLPAELQRFRTTAAALDVRRKSLRERIEGIQNDMVAVNGDLEALAIQGHVPTAEQLAAERDQRDSLWLRIRRKVWPEAGEQGTEVPLPAPQAYEASVQAADMTADRRYTDASRVAEHEGLQKRLAQMRHAIELEQQRLSAADQELTQLGVEWQALIQQYGLPTLGIAEMPDWLARRETFRQRHGNFAELQSRADAASLQAGTLRTQLSMALVEAGLSASTDGESLGQMIARARNFRRQSGEDAASEKILVKKLKAAEGRLTDAQKLIDDHGTALEAWRSAWNDAMALIRLGSNADGAEAAARLQQFDDLEDALATQDSGRTELATAQETLTRFEQEASRLCQATGYDRGQRPADAVVETLYDRLAEAKATAEQARSLAERVKEGERTRTQAERAVQQAEADLAGLMANAHCATLVELVEIEQQSAERRRLEIDLAGIESRLVTASALPLSDLLVQATGQDPAQVEASLTQTSRDLEESRIQVETLHVRLIDAEGRLGQVDGEAASAAAEQKAADAAARLSNLVADYSAARLASVILGEVVEAYQQRNQGPMLSRASELFATITSGRFERVVADFDEDLTVLVAVRPDGKRLKVGQLSSGRRDQLFLALRLAAIESHISSQEPLPVIVDDILINFDDEASSATFRVLADLSRRTQVLFFTHHEHLLGKAASAVGPEAFVGHRL